MVLAVLLVLFVSLPLLALAGTMNVDCDRNPEQCSPPDNHFHRTIRDGFCLRGTASEIWQKRYDIGASHSHATALYDGNILIVNGGMTPSGVTGATRAINIDELSTTNLPTSVPRYQHSAVRYGNYIVIYGGRNAANQYQQDVWRLEMSTTASSDPSAVSAWTQLDNTGSPRAAHTAVLWRNMMIIYGGRSDSSLYADVSAFNLDTSKWTVLSDVGMGQPRYHHAAAIANDQMYIHGGQWDSFVYGDLWAFDLVKGTWRQLLPAPGAAGVLNSARTAHSLVFMPACHSLIAFGGKDDSLTFVPDTMALNLNDDSIAFVQASKGFKDLARVFHSAIASGSRMYVFGGQLAASNSSGTLYEWI